VNLQARTAPAAARDELHRLSSVAQALATHLEIAAEAVCADLCDIQIARRGESAPAELARAARRYLHARRWRDAAFGPGLFADPCWDMMLDLFASEAEGRQVPISAACVASNVPSTTALRWLTRMEELGVIARTADPQDGRRIFLRLSEKARREVGAWIEMTFCEAEADGEDE
jgi:hypothetical protein